MKLIDKLMRDICDEMGWRNAPSPKLFSGAIRVRLTPRCDAVDAVVEAARVANKFLEDKTGHPEVFNLLNTVAALDKVRDA